MPHLIQLDCSHKIGIQSLAMLNGGMRFGKLKGTRPFMPYCIVVVSNCSRAGGNGLRKQGSVLDTQGRDDGKTG